MDVFAFGDDELAARQSVRDCDLLVVGLLPEMDRGNQYESQRCVAALEHENGRPDANDAHLGDLHGIALP